MSEKHVKALEQCSTETLKAFLRRLNAIEDSLTYTLCPIELGHVQRCDTPQVCQKQKTPPPCVEGCAVWLRWKTESRELLFVVTKAVDLILRRRSESERPT